MTILFPGYAILLITCLFLASLIFSTANFFGLGAAHYLEMLELLSLALIPPFILYIWTNWRLLTTGLKRPPSQIATMPSLATAMASVGLQIDATPIGRLDPPQFQLASTLMNALVSTFASMLVLNIDDDFKSLMAARFTVTSPNESLNDIAQASGRDS